MKKIQAKSLYLDFDGGKLCLTVTTERGAQTLIVAHPEQEVVACAVRKLLARLAEQTKAKRQHQLWMSGQVREGAAAVEKATE